MRSLVRRAAGAAGSVVKRANGIQQVSGAGALVLAVTAPFGGLGTVAEPPPEPLAIGETVDIGPYDVTLEKVFTLPSFEPEASVAPGNRVLVIRAEVTNTGDEPQPLGYLVGTGGGYTTVHGENTGVVPFEGEEHPVPQLYNVADERAFAASDVVNPGVTYRVALLLEQSGTWQGDSMTLALTAYEWESETTLALAGPHWVPAGTRWRGVVPVEVE